MLLTELAEVLNCKSFDLQEFCGVLQSFLLTAAEDLPAEKSIWRLEK